MVNIGSSRGPPQRLSNSRRPQNRRSGLPDFLCLSFVFIDILALFRSIVGGRLAVPAFGLRPEDATLIGAKVSTNRMLSATAVAA